MRILAFDMATTTGWAILDTDYGKAGSGVLIYKEGNRPLCLEARLINFKGDVNRLCLEAMPCAVVYEQAHHRGGPATRSALGMETVLRLTCWEHGIPAFSVHSMTLKKHATGSGKASKDQMISAANTLRGGRKVIDDNEADAVCLSYWGGDCLERNKKGEVEVKEGRRAKTKPRRKK